MCLVPRMHIFVRTLKGSLLEVEVTQYTSLKEIKEEIAKQEELEVEAIHLFYADKALLNEEITLSDLNVGHHW